MTGGHEVAPATESVDDTAPLTVQHLPGAWGRSTDPPGCRCHGREGTAAGCWGPAGVWGVAAHSPDLPGQPRGTLSPTAGAGALRRWLVAVRHGPPRVLGKQ